MMLSELDVVAQRARFQDFIREAEMERLLSKSDRPLTRYRKFFAKMVSSMDCFLILAGMRYSNFIRGTVTGMVGGLAGSILMYLFGSSIFALLRWPLNTSFTIIGDSAAAFFSKLGFALAGGPSLGMRLYFLIGLVLGAGMGFAIAGLEPLQLASPKKRVGLSILYVEVMSLPLLAAGTLALEMSAADAVLWFGISFIMHLVYGLILGIVMSKEEVWLVRTMG